MRNKKKRGAKYSVWYSFDIDDVLPPVWHVWSCRDSKKPNLTSLFCTHYITENVGQKLSQKTSEIHEFIMPCTKCKVERRKKETERKNILERQKGKQKMSCKEGQHLKLCSPKSEKEHSKKRSGREEELPPCNCPGRQAGRHDSPWQSQSPHLKGFLFWGNKAVQHTQ